uniref:Coiled-coil domain containing 148 n=1 Tax=Latimeria chalumnae TaxID=7897 RepID=H3AX29_LATCH
MLSKVTQRFRKWVYLRNNDIRKKLAVRMKNGLGSQKYKMVDYEQLQAVTEAKKLASENVEFKIQKTLQSAKHIKEQMLIKQHSQVWWQEQTKLAEARKKAELDLQQFFEEGCFVNPLLIEMIHLDLHLLEEQEAFKAATVEPIWHLKEDLKHRLVELKYLSPQQHHKADDFDIRNILKEVEFVKDQEKGVMRKLKLEQLALEKQIKATGIECLMQSYEEIPSHLHGILEEAQYLQCPYPDLKVSILREFQGLNEKYYYRLQEISERMKVTDRNCGWSEEDHWIFQTIIDQYSYNLPNRRTLYLDMLQRLLPHKSRNELVQHERSSDLYWFTVEQRKALIQSWSRDSKDLLLKAVMTFAEACVIHESELALANDRKRQQEICAELREKVRQCRGHQEEVAKLEAAIAARKQEEEEEKQRQEEEKKIHQRAADKEKIQNYYAEKQKKFEELQRTDQERLEELKKLMAEQAIKDRERVMFRQEMLQRRLEEKKVIALKQKHEEEERQRRLKTLRQQVAVTAEFDPVRMMGDTKASKARLRIGMQEEFVLQRPLFNLNTYNEKQVISDPRVRIEQALREAGLHNTFYAQEVLSKICPPKPPRRDMESTFFKM